MRPSTIVIAGVRDIESASSKAIYSLPTGQNSKAIVVHIDNLSESSAKDSVKLLESKHGITKLDVVIANAGISNYYGLAIDTPLSEVRSHFEVNTVGTLALFQATWPLLQAAPTPKFVAVTTGLASIGDMGSMPMPVAAYGTSKAAVNFITRKIHFENPDLIAFPISPGYEFPCTACLSFSDNNELQMGSDRYGQCWRSCSWNG
jgi:norsolorinic acid ketoreductase